ncbi:MAG: hypothetical protein CMN28_12300 [Salinisphaeraceae bacterium]|nr:hypothetical protein [Salinisphaeraceae bacterium]
MISEFLAQIDLAIQTFIFDGYENLSEALETPLRLTLTLFVIFHGYSLMTGRAVVSADMAFRQVFLAIFVVVLVQYAGLGASLVQNLFIDGPSQLAGAAIEGEDSQAGLKQNLSAVWDKGIGAASDTWESAGWGNLAGFGMALVILAVTVFMLIPAVAYLVLAKIALAILLVLTPFMVIMLLFGPTRGLFEGWLRQVINFALIPVLVYLVLALILSIADQAAEEISFQALTTEDTSLMPAIGAYVIVGAVSFVLFMQIYSVTSGIAGGVSLTTMNAFNQASRRPRQSAAKSARQLGRGAVFVGRNV